jgi:hypothetical protein
MPLTKPAPFPLVVQPARHPSTQRQSASRCRLGPRKATWPTTRCKSAGIGDESIYSPGEKINAKPQVMLANGGVVVLVTITYPKAASVSSEPLASG